MKSLEILRQSIRKAHLSNQDDVVSRLFSDSNIGPADRQKISDKAEQLVVKIREDSQPGLMEEFLSEYGLSSDEGIALMCLAEALLRVPDPETIDELIEDKIAPSSWGQHLGKSSSSLVNASTWALMLTGKVLDEDDSHGISGVLHGALKRLGEPIIRTAVKRAMQEMGNQFVLGETIASATRRGREMESKGFTYSYDMLGEAALTEADAQDFFKAYERSIKTLSKNAGSTDTRRNPGISVKLSALYPRYEVGQKSRAIAELTERTLELALLARQANMGFNIDAEESERLDLSLDIIQAVLSDSRLQGWDGFGVVVQAYSKRAALVIDWLYALAGSLDQKLMVRLVKGAYWDAEIKRSQVEGLKDYPVFCNKSFTDISYICCAKKLLAMSDRIYPQFATHNAHSVAAILSYAQDAERYEFQRLHGMGEAMHRLVMQESGTRCRIYAPVGTHRDLLAYLVRRLLENGANSSFVNQIVDEKILPSEIAADPFLEIEKEVAEKHSKIPLPKDLYAPERINSKGWDLNDELDLSDIEQARNSFNSIQWLAEPLLATSYTGTAPKKVFNPADPQDVIGTVIQANAQDATDAILAAKSWHEESGVTRSLVLNKAADLYEENFAELFAALTREAGKTPLDAIAELREAVDFLRYYAARIDSLHNRVPRGVVGCISPWNFPLAIFTGQIAAALSAGNGVVAKPADPTPMIATIAVRLMHRAGVPKAVLQLLPGRGSVVGARLVADPKINTICFTGSTTTAQTINTSMAEHMHPGTPLIAETGGLNVMMVDSTALPQQAVRDILTSAFQSAGQRCSALRLLYLQEDIADVFMDMLFGAMNELVIGNPWLYSTDVGPVINQAALQSIQEYIEQQKKQGRLLKQLIAPTDGTFVAPTVIRVKGVEDLKEEIFGPVLHIATFRSDEIDSVVEKINASGYGLTFGLHTRIDDRVEQIVSQLNVGNMYINRNQIGAIVGSQPFGGEGLSGTGPKAGGPHYVQRFSTQIHSRQSADYSGQRIEFSVLQRALDAVVRPDRRIMQSIELPGPTGESNRLSIFPRGTILCLGPTLADAAGQAAVAKSRGCSTLIVCPCAEGDDALDGFVHRDDLARLAGFEAVVLWGSEQDLRLVRRALASRTGPLVPLINDADIGDWCQLERHVCIDTTASGGNASLLAQSG
ncbi:MAG: RHH-type proline utilization regulon transcriptional repressor/proline dehydrogenase [Parasphingorhabdus sp.]|jgi:RHH-type proline utilization regulon transcriptional repressor/proline dehydrogenase/delta 1-pyrroline-5-carboxylate dehydrogenase